MIAAQWLDVLRVLIWPVVVVLLVITFVWTKRGRSFFQQTIHKVTAFGVEVSLDPSTATEVKEGADELFKRYREIITSDLEQEDLRYDLQGRLGLVAREFLAPYLDAQGYPTAARNTIRCTIYMPDVLFESALCQLTDYVDLGGSRCGLGRGRAFTVRFGIIGLAWRLKGLRVEPSVSTVVQELIAHWGMTREEAESAGAGRQAFAAVTLWYANHLVGLFYADADAPSTFGPREHEQAFAAIVRRGASRTGLDEVLRHINQKFERRGPRIVAFEK